MCRLSFTVALQTTPNKRITPRNSQTLSHTTFIGTVLPSHHHQHHQQHILLRTSSAKRVRSSSSSSSPSTVPTPPEQKIETTTPIEAADSYDDDEDDDDEDESRRDPEFTLILAACAVGVATGGSVVAFNDAIHWIRDTIWHGETLLTGRELLQQFSEFDLWPRIVFPPVLGGLFVGSLGLFVGGYSDPSPLPPLTFSPSTRSTSKDNNKSSNSSSSSSSSANDDDVVDDDAEQQRRINAFTKPVARALAAAVTLGTGASLGPEGPSVDIGRSCAKGVSSILRDPQRHLTSLVAAGSGAGVAAGFNAPIAGVFFAFETVLQKQLLRAVVSSAEDDGTAKQAKQQVQRMQDSSALTVAMVLLASVVAAVVSQAGLGSSPAFRVPEYRLQSLYELPLYLVFGALCGAVSASFSYSARVAEDAFTELKQSPDGGGGGGVGGVLSVALLPALGGLTTGVLALGYPEILYEGFENVSFVLSSNSGQYPPGLLVQIVVLKIIATTISRGSGLQGGLYAPSIFIGAALGSAFGLLVHAVGDPSGLLLSAPQAYALVGVAAMLASNCGVPLTSILLLFELTRDYLIIVPTLAAVGISFWISSLAAPGVKNAVTRRQRRRAAAMAAASAVASPADSALLETIKERLLDGALLQEGASESSSGRLGDESGGENSNASVGGSLLTSTDNDQSLVLACAVDRGCLLLQPDMSLAQALALMEAEDQSAAVVVGQSGIVLALLSTEVQAIESINDNNIVAGGAVDSRDTDGR